MKFNMKKAQYIFEYIIFISLYSVLKLLPIDVSSSLGGFIGRTIGPYTHLNKVAYKNLLRAYPHKKDSEYKAILSKMWNNLGRTFFEMPHLNKIVSSNKNRIKLTGLENINSLKNKALIFYSGHFGNWELYSYIMTSIGFPVSLLYRSPNNPYFDKFLKKHRFSSQNPPIAKSKTSLRKVLKILSEDGVVGVLVDQKLNEGPSIPFFGHDAKTNPIIALVGMSQNCPIVPARIKRLKGAYFELIFFKSYYLKTDTDKKTTIQNALTDMNATLEEWINETPEQWLWVHNRWPKKES